MKIVNDKYYTPIDLAKWCVKKAKEVIGEKNITEYIEPSAGCGVFFDFLDKPYRAYDILPDDKRIECQDWLKLDLPYKKGRCIIGNPPFGKGTVTSNKFCKKSFKCADYVCFILPICQFNNTEELYEFDLIYSYDLGERIFSGVVVHCCYNIYKRPLNGVANKKQKQYQLKDITMREVRKSRNQFLPSGFIYDIGIVAWGSVGKIIDEGKEGTYQKELYIKCNNDKIKDKVVKTIKNISWKDFTISNKSPTISQWMLRKYLKETIPEIK